MKITAQQKSRYFALYLGQTIVNVDDEIEYMGLYSFKLSGVITEDLTIKSESEFVTVKKDSIVISGDFSGVGNSGVGYESIDYYALELRSIENLTDEEYSVLAKWSAYELTEKNITEVGRSMANHLFELNKWSGASILEMCDYLRSIGIALPYHDGTRLITLQELIDEKVIKVI